MLSPFECLCGNFILPEPASYVFFYAFFNLRNLLYLIAGQGKGAAPQQPEPGTGGAVTKKRRRPIHLHVMVSEEELALIQERMAEAGIRNMGAYMRKMALSGYVLHIDLSPVQELVSLQRRCSNNLNQVAIQANTYGGIYPEEIKMLQRDYEKLWRPLSDLLEKLSAIVRL